MKHESTMTAYTLAWHHVFVFLAQSHSRMARQPSSLLPPSCLLHMECSAVNSQAASARNPSIVSAHPFSPSLAVLPVLLSCTAETLFNKGLGHWGHVDHPIILTRFFASMIWVKKSTHKNRILPCFLLVFLGGSLELVLSFCVLCLYSHSLGILLMLKFPWVSHCMWKILWVYVHVNPKLPMTPWWHATLKRFDQYLLGYKAGCHYRFSLRMDTYGATVSPVPLRIQSGKQPKTSNRIPKPCQKQTWMCCGTFCAAFGVCQRLPIIPSLSWLRELARTLMQCS